MIKAPPVRQVVEVYAMLAPWSLHRTGWVASRALLEAMADEYGAPRVLADPAMASMLMGIPVRVDESVQGLLLEWR